MVQLTIAQKVFIVKKFHETGSLQATRGNETSTAYMELKTTITDLDISEICILF
jgi:hypothetical protein